MRTLCAWVMAVAFSALLPAAVLATADGPDFYKITGIERGAAITMRSGPGTRERRIASLPHDAAGLRNLGCQGGLSFDQWQKASERERERAKYRRWCKVDYKGTIGWLPGRFLIEDGSFRAQAAAMPKLAGVTWALISADGKPAAGKAWISFAKEGRILGNSGCNIFRGSAKLGDGSVEIAPLAATNMACRDEAASAQEGLLLGILSGQLNYRIEDRRLILTGPSGGTTLTFASAGNAAQ